MPPDPDALVLKATVDVKLVTVLPLASSATISMLNAVPAVWVAIFAPLVLVTTNLASAPGLTVIITPKVVLPVALVAFTVYVAVPVVVVGVPLITPVEVLRLRPAGSDGLTL